MNTIAGLSLPGAATRVVPAAERKALVREVATLSRLRFGLRALHEDLVRALAPEDSSVGLPLSSLELPPGGKEMLRLTRPWWAMACLGAIGAHRLFAALETEHLRKAPALVLITSTPDDQGALACGRLLVQIGLAATAAGHVIHPYFLPGALDSLVDHASSRSLRTTDVALIRTALDSLRDGAPLGLRPRFLIRVGIPCRPASRSRRLPVHQLIAPTAEECP